MTHGTRRPLRFSGRRGRKVEASFQGRAITGNGGVMLVSEQDRRLGPGARIARLLGDPRRSASCRHSRLNLLRQRLHALCLGHEDLNDHDELRHDAALQTAVDRDTALTSASTLCRFELQADSSCSVSIHQVLLEAVTGGRIWALEGIGESVRTEKEMGGKVVSDRKQIDWDRSVLPSVESVDGKDGISERESLSDKAPDPPARGKRVEMDLGL